MIMIEIPSPDDLMENLLKSTFGSSSVIVAVYLLVTSLQSWWDLGKKTANRTRRGIAMTAEVYAQLRRIGPVQVVSALIVTVVLLAIQAVWLASSYVIGNGVSLFALDRPVHDGPHWADFLGSLRWDVVSGAYVALAALALVVQYRQGDNKVVPVIMFPLALFGGLCGLGALLGGLMWALLTWKPDPNIDFTAAWAGHFGVQAGSVAGVALAYAISTSVIMRTPGQIARAWAKPKAPDDLRVLSGTSEWDYHWEPKMAPPSGSGMTTRRGRT